MNDKEVEKLIEWTLDFLEPFKYLFKRVYGDSYNEVVNKHVRQCVMNKTLQEEVKKGTSDKDIKDLIRNRFEVELVRGFDGSWFTTLPLAADMDRMLNMKVRPDDEGNDE